MSDDPERPRIPLSDEQRRSGAQKLSALLRAHDEAALQRFRKQRADHAEEGDLETMRAVLEALALQLEDGDGEGWERVRDAWSRLRPAPPPEPEPEVDDPASDEPTPAEDKPSLEKPLSEVDNPPLPVVPSSAWARWSRGEAEPPRWEAPDYSDGSVTPALEPNVDETVPLGRPIVLADATGAIELPEARDPLPFKRSDDDPTRQHTYISVAHGLALDVEEYAALCAERDWSPERRNSIYERYEVVTDRCREAVDRAYELRFARDPALRSLWQQYYVRFSTALKAR